MLVQKLLVTFINVSSIVLPFTGKDLLSNNQVLVSATENRLFFSVHLRVGC